MTNTVQVAAIKITTKPINLDKNHDDLHIVLTISVMRTIIKSNGVILLYVGNGAKEKLKIH